MTKKMTSVMNKNVHSGLNGLDFHLVLYHVVEEPESLQENVYLETSVILDVRDLPHQKNFVMEEYV